jgi:hypothetical protein
VEHIAARCCAERMYRPSRYQIVCTQDSEAASQRTTLDRSNFVTHHVTQIRIAIIHVGRRVMRKSFSPHEKLTATLTKLTTLARLLPIGRSYEDLLFLTIKSPQALGYIIHLAFWLDDRNPHTFRSVGLRRTVQV